jgi:tetratricopeptide (TPR) repeat protein
MLYEAYSLQQPAVACYLNAQTLDPHQFEWPYYLGYLYQVAGDLSQAADSFERAVRIQPNKVALLRLAEVDLDLGRMAAARVLFERVLPVREFTPVGLVGLGRIALSAREFGKAVDYFDKALSLQPQASSIHQLLAAGYRGLGDLAKAQDHLAKAGQVLPKVPDQFLDGLEKLKKGKSNLLVRAQQAMDEGRFQEAAEVFRRIVAIAPDDANSRTNLGVALAEAGNVQEATAELTEALRLAPDDAHSHYSLALVLIAGGSEQQAMDQLQASVKLDPAQKEAHFQLANLLMRADRCEEAAHEYSQVVRIEPGNSAARIMEAIALVRINNYSQARTRLERAHNILTDDFNIADVLARLLAASPDNDVRDGRRALLLIQQAIRDRGSMDADQGQTLAMALAETGQFAKAAGLQRLIIQDLAESKEFDSLPTLRDNLTLYERGQPSRMPWRDDDPIFRPVPKVRIPGASSRDPGVVVENRRR